MRYEIESARDPVLKGPTCVDLIVKFSHLPNEVTFSANANDCEEHGRFLYNSAMNGDYGPIEEG